MHQGHSRDGSGDVWAMKTVTSTFAEYLLRARQCADLSNSELLNSV
jgi:hypothetical protein